MNKEIELTAKPPILVAHRGYSGRYPENTLLAYEAAHAHGARYMELDLQLSSDQIPIVHHDASLMRMAGVDQDIRDTKAKYIKAMRAAYPNRFGDEFNDNTFCTFKKFCKWLRAHPDTTVFVEIKQESIDRFGIPVFMDEVYKRIVSIDVELQCVIISFNPEALEYAQKISPMRIGWVLPAWNDDIHQRLQQLNPAFAFCDVESFPDNDQHVWQGTWQWALYNLDEISSAIVMANRGIGFLETNQIGLLMSHDGLANRLA